MTTATPTAPAAALTGARAKAQVVYIGLSGLFIVGVWIAFFLAGAGVFGLNERDLTTKHLEDQTVLDAHRVT